MHITSAEHLSRPIHPGAPICHAAHLCSPGGQSGAPPRWIKAARPSPPSPPHHQMWLTASHRKEEGGVGVGGWLFTSLCSHGTKLMIPANKIIQRGKSLRSRAPGWTIWSSFGFLKRGLEKKKLCEENFRDSGETDGAVQPREWELKGGFRGKLCFQKKSLPGLYCYIHLSPGLWTVWLAD